MKAQRKPSRRLTAQPLENRRLMAGDVSVDWDYSPGRTSYDISIDGDGAANGVEVRELASGQIQIRGVNRGGSSTTINGRDRITLPSRVGNSRLDDIFADMGRGSDSLLVRDLTLDAFAGARMEIQTGNGHDIVDLQNVEIRNDLVIRDSTGDSGGDTIRLTGVEADDLFINTYGGDDTITIRSTDIYDLVEINTHGGSDTVDVSNLDAWRMNVNTGSGDDDLLMRSVQLETLNADLGSGTDFFRPIYVRASGIVSGGGNIDTFDLRWQGTGFNVWVTQFEGGLQ